MKGYIQSMKDPPTTMITMSTMILATNLKMITCFENSQVNFRSHKRSSSYIFIRKSLKSLKNDIKKKFAKKGNILDLMFGGAKFFKTALHTYVILNVANR